MKTMFIPTIRNALLSLLLAGLAACSSAPKSQAPALERANAIDKEARRALRDGDLLVARNLFGEERRLHQSLDNLPGIATTAINLSTVLHQMGNDEQALGLLDGILGDTLTPYPAEMRSAAAFRKAVILVSAGKAAEAAAAIEFAAQACGKSCELSAGIYNLRARLALSRGEHASALNQAKLALDAAGDNRDELANARRISGAAQLALGQHNLALEHYQAALALDKQNGASGRIAEDLDGITKALTQLGRKDEAAAYARRAAAVHEALRYKPGNVQNPSK